jgi:hypothetical protein
MQEDHIYLRPTPPLSKEATECIMATLHNPGAASPAVKKLAAKANALKKSLAKKSAKSQTKALA